MEHPDSEHCLPHSTGAELTPGNGVTATIGEVTDPLTSTSGEYMRPDLVQLEDVPSVGAQVVVTGTEGPAYIPTDHLGEPADPLQSSSGPTPTPVTSACIELSSLDADSHADSGASDVLSEVITNATVMCSDEPSSTAAGSNSNTASQEGCEDVTVSPCPLPASSSPSEVPKLLTTDTSRTDDATVSICVSDFSTTPSACRQSPAPADLTDTTVGSEPTDELSEDIGKRVRLEDLDHMSSDKSTVMPSLVSVVSADCASSAPLPDMPIPSATCETTSAAELAGEPCQFVLTVPPALSPSQDAALTSAPLTGDSSEDDIPAAASDVANTSMGHADLYAHQFTNELSQPSIPPANSASLESKSSDLNARTGLDSPRELTLPPGGLGSDPPLASMRVGIPHDLTTTGDEVSMSGCPSSPGLLLSQISSLSLDANEFGGAGDHNEDANKLDSGSMCARDSASLPEVEDAVHSSAIDCVTACHGFSLPCESLPAEDSTLSVIASSPPSSSPPCPSSSQPQSLYDTPPSSSPPVEAPWDVDCGLTSSSTTQVDVSASLGTTSKRALEIDESDDEHRPRKRTRSDSVSDRSPPQPIRPTPASQAKQYKKLAAPFRSPVIKGPLVQGGLHAVYASGRAPSMVVRKLPEDENIAKPDVSVEPASLVANKDRTAKAAKQFKSPVQPTSPNTVTSSKFTPASGTFSRIGAAPTIQALQGQVQTLKQAIKIKNSGDRDEDQVLEQLVEKWTEVGREVAWAVWGYVKDLDPGPGEQQKSGWFADEDEVKAGRKRGFDSNWGYGEEPARKKGKTESDAEAESTEDVEPPVVQHTVGVMLRRLGIDPDTLGWNEDEGDFVDV